MAFTDNKYSSDSSSTTSITISDTTSNADKDGYNTIVLSKIDASNGLTVVATATVVVRIIWDVCSPSMTVSGSLASSFDYIIGASRNTLTLGNYDSGTCESEIQVFVDGVTLASTGHTFLGYSVTSRTFTVTAPYSYTGTTVNG